MTADLIIFLSVPRLSQLVQNRATRERGREDFLKKNVLFVVICSGSWTRHVLLSCNHGTSLRMRHNTSLHFGRSHFLTWMCPLVMAPLPAQVLTFATLLCSSKERKTTINFHLAGEDGAPEGSWQHRVSSGLSLESFLTWD